MLQQSRASLKISTNRKLGMSVKDLRNALLGSDERQRFCLALDHLPKLHHPRQHLRELLRIIALWFLE